jgi:hypothetical protein
MELKRIPVRVDIVKPHQGEMMQVVSGDNEGNLFEINLTMNGRPYNIGNNIVQIVFKKPDGTKVTQSTEDIDLPITIEGNHIYCTLKSNTIAVKGKIQAEIQVTDGTRLITSAQFYFIVRLPIIDDETVESTNELSLLVAAVQAEAERKTAELQREQNENARQELKAQLDSMKATLQGWLDDPEQFRGPKGEQGPKGDKGDKGDKGEPGDIANLTSEHVTTALGYNPMPISGGTLESYREKLVTLVEGSIDLSLGNVFVHAPSASTTYSILNAVPGVAHSFTLIINMNTVYTLTFPSSVKWQGGEIPDMSTANKTYVLTFVTINGGTTWLGMFGGEF